VRVRKLHDWPESTTEAIELQRQLASQIMRCGQAANPRFVAGTDISVDRKQGKATAAVVVLDYPGMKPVEIQLAGGALDYPYVPGLLSFRELPLMLAAFQKLSITPDLVLVDGQGIAHPRRLGLAAHLGLFLDMPTIGCAKSRLLGKHEIPGDEPGDFVWLLDGGEVIGVVLRTKYRVKPLYISVGHKISLNEAIRLVLMSARGYRLPEPTRLAHLAADGKLGLDDTYGNV
jgi:deoxyribonuclease V